MIENIEKEKVDEINLHINISKNYANIRERNKASRYYNDYWASDMLSLLDHSPKILLDYGCGTGRLYPHIKKNFKSAYLGIDISKDMLDVAREKFHDIKTLRVDGEKLKLNSGYFDAVIVFGSLHHLQHPEKGLSEIRRVLTDNGILLISEPTSNIVVTIIRKLFYRLKKKHFSPTHKSFLHEELISLIRRNGFKIRKIKYFGFLAFPFGLPDIVPFVSYIPLKLLKFLIKIDKILLKIPIIRSFRFATTILAEKQVSKQPR